MEGSELRGVRGNAVLDAQSEAGLCAGWVKKAVIQRAKPEAGQKAGNLTENGALGLHGKQKLQDPFLRTNGEPAGPRGQRDS